MSESRRVRPAMRELRQPADEPRIATDRPGPWLTASRGLRTYNLGLVLRLALGVVFPITLLLAATTSGATGRIGVVFAFVGVATGFVMLAGLSQFARQPVDSPGRGSARFAATVLAISVGIELLCVLLTVLIAGLGQKDVEMSERFAAHVATLWRWGAALWLAHVGATIVAMWKLSTLVEERPPGRRRFVLPVLVLVAGVLIFSTWNMLPTLGLGVTGSILLVCVSALLALVAMAFYAAAVDHLAKALRQVGQRRVPKSTVKSETAS